jgi:hypothetical protein
MSLPKSQNHQFQRLPEAMTPSLEVARLRFCLWTPLPLMFPLALHERCSPSSLPSHKPVEARRGPIVDSVSVAQGLR